MWFIFTEQWFNERYNEAKMNSTSLSPSIMKKRGYEQTNGIDGITFSAICFSGGYIAITSSVRFIFL